MQKNTGRHPLSSFSSDVFGWLSKAMEENGSVSPTVFVAEERDGVARMRGAFPLGLLLKPGEDNGDVPAVIGRLLSEGAPAVAVAHEAWLTALPGSNGRIPVDVSPREIGKRVDTVCVSISTIASQCVAMHRVRKTANGRRMKEGVPTGSDVELRGRMAMETPTLH